MALSRNEEVELVLRAQTGDAEALACLVEEHYAPRIAWLARRYRCRGLPKDDQIQNGKEAFIRALRQFDPAFGTRLWTYVSKVVSSAMIAACAEQLELSDQTRKYYGRVVNAYDRMQQDRQSAPTAAEVAQACDVSVGVVEEVFASWQGRTMPLPPEDDSPNDEDDRRTPKLGQVSPSPEDVILEIEGSRERYDRIMSLLGPPDGPKFLALAILHEKMTDKKAYNWSEIARLLTDPNAEPNPPWEEMSADFHHLAAVPTDWTGVRALFQVPPPVLTEGALKQWYSRLKRGLQALRPEDASGEKQSNGDRAPTRPD